MNKYIEFLLNLFAQFGGGRGEIENELARFGYASALWGGLLIISHKRWKNKSLRDEKFIAWGFGICFIREIFMFTVFSLIILKIFDFETMHLFFPPLEHFLALSAVVVVAAAYWRFILKDIVNSRRYLRIGIGITIFCYIITAFWWAHFSAANPLVKFGQTWCDWLFRIIAVILIAIPIFVLAKKRSWISNIVVTALVMFLLDEVLMLVNLANGDIYKNIFGPIRHGLHILAILPLGYVYIKELSIERDLAEEKIKKENEISSSLLKTFNILNASLDVKDIVKNVIEIAPKYLKFDKLIIFLYGRNTNEIIYSYAYGFKQEENKQVEASFKKDGIRIELGKEPIILNDSNKYDLFTKDFADALKMNSAIILPIFFSGHLEAVLIGGYSDTEQININDIYFLKSLSDGVGVVIKNAIFVEDVQQLLTNTITSFALILDTKSRWTRGHTQRVTKYAISIAEKMKLNENEIKTIWLGGLLHDIGKVGTSDTILDKPDKLTKEEFEIVKKHPAQGASILETIKQLKDIIPIVKFHHERYDGKGYPDGLEGEKIPLYARLLCVADAYDAMIEDRPYRKAMGKKFAIEEIKRCSGSQFDPKVVEIFITLDL